VRIAYVYDAVHPWVTGGVEKRLWELSTRLADEHDVHWYGLKYWDGPAVREESGVTLHGVDDPPADLYTDGRRSIPEALSFAGKVARPLANEEFDVIDAKLVATVAPRIPGERADHLLAAELRDRLGRLRAAVVALVEPAEGLGFEDLHHQSVRRLLAAVGCDRLVGIPRVDVFDVLRDGFR